MSLMVKHLLSVTLLCQTVLGTFLGHFLSGFYCVGILYWVYLYWLSFVPGIFCLGSPFVWGYLLSRFSFTLKFAMGCGDYPKEGSAIAMLGLL